MPKITELWAWCVEDEDGKGGEGIPAINSTLEGEPYLMPLVGADAERMLSFRVIAQDIATRTGKSLQLRRATALEVIETVHPKPRGQNGST